MELIMEGLSKQFGSKYAVKQVTAHLNPGVYGLLGANGAGKTTLMRMVCGILDPSAGRILYGGTGIDKLGEKYRDVLGYLPQDFGYYPDFTAREYLDFIAAIKGVVDKNARKKVEELLELVNLSDVANRKIRTFSGGMKQRLGIAQAVINDPQILVLDEPTAGLDPKERMRFRNLIADLSKDKIVILSTHIVSDIDYIANDILMMKNGELIFNGSVEDAINSMEGKVWNCVLPESQADKVSSSFRVANLRHEGNSLVTLRIVSDESPLRNASAAEPTLEDLYLYHFQEEEEERS